MSRPSSGVHCGWPYEVSSACPSIAQARQASVSSTNTVGGLFPVCFSPQSSFNFESCATDHAWQAARGFADGCAVWHPRWVRPQVALEELFRMEQHLAKVVLSVSVRVYVPEL